MNHYQQNEKRSKLLINGFLRGFQWEYLCTHCPEDIHQLIFDHYFSPHGHWIHRNLHIQVVNTEKQENLPLSGCIRSHCYEACTLQPNETLTGFSTNFSKYPTNGFCSCIDAAYMEHYHAEPEHPNYRSEIWRMYPMPTGGFIIRPTNINESEDVAWNMETKYLGILIVVILCRFSFSFLMIW